jgi:rhomboid protease GluP
MRIANNAPFTLGLAFACLAVLISGGLTAGWSIVHLFSLPAPTPWDTWWLYPRLLLHVLGHANPEHLFSNLTILLLIGPLLEQQYGAARLAAIAALTAAVTGLIMLVLFSGLLLGASGIVFAFIILSSFANTKSGTIPLTFVLVCILFLGNEVFMALTVDDNVARFAHIAGGVVGAATGFAARPK